MKNKLIIELSKLKVKNNKKLQEYVDFCINNNQNNRIQGKTSHHHILPNKLFSEYSNLKENDWNGSHLLYADHYYAHFLLTEAIDEFNILYSFCAMHNKDLTNGRLTEEDLISPQDFQKKMENRGIQYSKYLKEIVYYENEYITRGSMYSRKAADKMKNGIRAEAEKKRMETINKIIIINGEETSIAKEKSRKGLLTKRQPIIINGIETTIEKEAAKKSAETQTKNGPRYDIHHINGLVIDVNVPIRKVRELSQSLEYKTKDDYLGKTTRSKITLNTHNRLHLIGYYVIKVN